MRWFLLGMALSLYAAPPTISDLMPRGAQKGRPFTLRLVGRELKDVIKIHSTLPASFTALADSTAGPMEGRYASFLVEPKAGLQSGVYPVRVETAEGISNVQLFSIGDFPETTEDESEMGAKPNSNDSIEAAQSLPASAVTLTGTLRGAERDFYRFQGKLGERRVIEIEGRRVGSAVDPVLRVFDQSGKLLARSEDTPMLGLDARVDVKLPKDGYYYVEVHDARFSTQTANFYRLKTGSYSYPTDLYPLGGRRGETVEVSMGGPVPVKVEAQRFVNLPDSPALPLPFDVGEYPERREPVAEALALPVTVNGRLAQAGEVDRYRFAVEPGQKLMLEVKARELGTSKIMAVLDISDAAGKRIARSGDEPLPEELYTVGGSRTAGDPYAFFEVPKDVREIQVSVEDLARRGGPAFAYRLTARPATEEFTLNINAPFVNIPAGGSVFVPVSIERKGYMGDVRVRVKNPPKGLIVEGGYIPAQLALAIQGNRGFIRNGALILSAQPGVKLEPGELELEGVGKLADGKEIVRKGTGLGMSVGVAGATIQGAVDRQRAVTGAWMDMDLPVAGTTALPATLAVTLEKTTRKAAGDEFLFRWKWSGASFDFPATVSMDMVGAADIRAIEMRQDPKDKSTGTFLVTTTRLTLPGTYDFYVLGRLTSMGQTLDIYSRPIEVLVKEAPADVPATDAR